jgi:glucosamine 6-phosphate synthetase-like amidotransferase/phosphosugar isomerase protein
MTDDRSWLTDDYPELRDGPPWVMEEMILEERDLPVGILDGTGPETADVAAAIREAAAQGDPIVVTGCGTSEHGAMAIAELIADAFPDARVEAREALDAAFHPRKGGLCIGISHDGGTRATRLALEAARGAGASTAVITAHPATSVPAVSDHVVVTPLADRSWCHTVAYVSAIVAGAGSPSRRRRPGWPVRSTRSSRFARCSSRRPAASTAAPHRDDGPRSGFITARELALKIEEARIPANAHRLETVLHGHLAGCDADRTAVVRFAIDARGEPPAGVGRTSTPLSR